MTAQMSVQTSDVDMVWPVVLSRISLMMNRNLSVMSWTESFLLAGLNNPSFRMALMDFEMFHRRVGDYLAAFVAEGGFVLVGPVILGDVAGWLLTCSIGLLLLRWRRWRAL